MTRLNVRLSVAAHGIVDRPLGGGALTVLDPLAPDLTDRWVPHVRLGAPAPGGLALPAASPTRAWMYSPRGVFVDDEHVVAVDSGNHRVLIWHGLPTADEQPADVVLGQPDGTTEGRAAGGRGPQRGMNLPTGALIHEGRLVVADAWHHRILVWHQVPDHDDTAPDLVLGQSDDTAVEPNRGGGCSASSLYWPFGGVRSVVAHHPDKESADFAAVQVQKAATRHEDAIPVVEPRPEKYPGDGETA